MAADGRPYDPELVVEFAFGATWQTPEASRTWVDVSAWAEVALSSNRGRTNELELFSAARCTITLNNDDRRFDPLNTAGPYYGLLVPGVPVRVRALLNGVSYPRFSGFADGFHHKPGTHSGTVTVPCADGFKTLAGVPLPRTVYEHEVKSDGPWLYWPLTESATDLASDLSGNKRDGVYSRRSITQGADTLRPFAGGSLEIVEGATVAVAGPAGQRITSGSITFEAWVLPHALPVGTAYITRIGSGSTDDGSLLAITDADGGSIIFAAKYADARAGVWDLPTAAQPWHIVVGWDDDAGKYNCFIDGVERAAKFDPGPPWSPDSFPPRVIVGHDAGQSLVGRVSDVAIYNAAPTAELARRHYNAAVRPWFGDLTGQRVERILDLIGWPEDLRDIDPGAVVCGNADIAGMSALDYLQVLAQTEQGRLFIAADGKLTFHSLDRTLTGPSACTFTDDGTGAGIVEGSLTFTLDDTFVYDAAEVQRKYGPYQRAGVDVPTKVVSITGLASRDDRRARVLAERLVARYRTPRTRADAWTVQPQNDPSSWAAILALEVGDVVTLDAT
ncbi:MAG TPA: LamG-like jellyroll fold domain-containing protein, partial [Microbacterium sp.]|nr:LamG-like jellyroll fold domain-containing protein [Microbacterium sp.]